MYERFTDRARKVMQAANAEATLRHHQQVTANHIAIGLLRNLGGVASTILDRLKINAALLYERIHIEMPGGDSREPGKGRLPHSEAAKAVVESAIQAARDLQHNYVGTEHLLLGLLKEKGSYANVVFDQAKLTVEGVQEEIKALLAEMGETNAKSPEEVEGDRLDRQARIDLMVALAPVLCRLTRQDVDSIIVALYMFRARMWSQDTPPTQGDDRGG